MDCIHEEKNMETTHISWSILQRRHRDLELDRMDGEDPEVIEEKRRKIMLLEQKLLDSEIRKHLAEEKIRMEENNYSSKKERTAASLNSIRLRTNLHMASIFSSMAENIDGER